jgi:hypothetical protein
VPDSTAAQTSQPPETKPIDSDPESEPGSESETKEEENEEKDLPTTGKLESNDTATTDETKRD